MRTQSVFLSKLIKNSSVKPKYSNIIEDFLSAIQKIQQISQKPQFVTTDRIYKPSYTIEFNREGEVLLFSQEPNKILPVYSVYPYILYESLIPLFVINYFQNYLNLPWEYNTVQLFIACACVVPRFWYLYDFRYYPRRLYLLRGGKVLKIEQQSLFGDRHTSWFETYQFTSDELQFDNQDQADFLEEEGQLKYKLTVQLEHLTEMGVTQQQQLLRFLQEGKVHHPELFEAALKGFNIDTSDFVINTAEVSRSREGNHGN